MTTHEEDRLEVLRLSTKLAQFMCVLPQGFGVLEEFGGHGIIFECFDGGGVQWGFAAIW